MPPRKITRSNLITLRDTLRPVPLDADNIFAQNRTLNPRRVGKAFAELSRPRLFEQVLRYPAFAHNALIEVLHERLEP